MNSIQEGNLPRRGPKPKFLDAEFIALSILSEGLMYDSEYYLRFPEKVKTHFFKKPF